MSKNIKQEVLITHKQTFRVFVSGSVEMDIKAKACKAILAGDGLKSKFLIDDTIEVLIVGKDSKNKDEKCDQE